MDQSPELSFPLTFVMKVIMQAESLPGENRGKLAAVFDSLSLASSGWTEKASEAGRYVSYSVMLTAGDRERFLLVHEKVSKVSGVRYVL